MGEEGRPMGELAPGGAGYGPPSPLQPFILCEQPHYLLLNGSLFRRPGRRIALLHQRLDLLLNRLLLRLRLSALPYVVLIVHTVIVTRPRAFSFRNVNAYNRHTGARSRPDAPTT